MRNAKQATEDAKDVIRHEVIRRKADVQAAARD
jgi:hypothetical protein